MCIDDLCMVLAKMSDVQQWQKDEYARMRASQLGNARITQAELDADIAQVRSELQTLAQLVVDDYVPVTNTNQTNATLADSTTIYGNLNWDPTDARYGGAYPINPFTGMITPRVLNAFNVTDHMVRLIRDHVNVTTEAGQTIGTRTWTDVVHPNLDATSVADRLVDLIYNNTTLGMWEVVGGIPVEIPGGPVAAREREVVARDAAISTAIAAQPPFLRTDVNTGGIGIDITWTSSAGTLTAGTLNSWAVTDRLVRLIRDHVNVTTEAGQTIGTRTWTDVAHPNLDATSVTDRLVNLIYNNETLFTEGASGGPVAARAREVVARDAAISTAIAAQPPFLRTDVNTGGIGIDITWTSSAGTLTAGTLNSWAVTDRLVRLIRDHVNVTTEAGQTIGTRTWTDVAHSVPLENSNQTNATLADSTTIYGNLNWDPTDARYGGAYPINPFTGMITPRVLNAFNVTDHMVRLIRDHVNVTTEAGQTIGTRTWTDVAHPNLDATSVTDRLVNLIHENTTSTIDSQSGGPVAARAREIAAAIAVHDADITAHAQENFVKALSETNASVSNMRGRWEWAWNPNDVNNLSANDPNPGGATGLQAIDGWDEFGPGGYDGMVTPRVLNAYFVTTRVSQLIYQDRWVRDTVENARIAAATQLADAVTVGVATAATSAAALYIPFTSPQGRRYFTRSYRWCNWNLEDSGNGLGNAINWIPPEFANHSLTGMANSRIINWTLKRCEVEPLPIGTTENNIGLGLQTAGLILPDELAHPLATLQELSNMHIAANNTAWRFLDVGWTGHANDGRLLGIRNKRKCQDVRWSTQLGDFHVECIGVESHSNTAPNRFFHVELPHWNDISNTGTVGTTVPAMLECEIEWEAWPV